MWADIVTRPYITLGMLGLTSLIPLRRDVDDGDDPAARRPELDATASPRPTWPESAACSTTSGWPKVGVRDPYWYAAALALLLGVRAWAWGRAPLRRRGAVAATPRRRPARSPKALSRSAPRP
jgi:hypothetical protein